MNDTRLYDGMTMLILGDGLPSGMASGSCGLSPIHRQPLRPAAGGGSSLNVGQRIVQITAEAQSTQILENIS